MREFSQNDRELEVYPYPEGMHEEMWEMLACICSPFTTAKTWNGKSPFLSPSRGGYFPEVLWS